MISVDWLQSKRSRPLRFLWGIQTFDVFKASYFSRWGNCVLENISYNFFFFYLMLTIVIWHQFHYSVHGQCLGIKEGISRRESVFPLKKGQMIEGWTFHSSFCFMSSNHSTDFNRIHQTVLVFTDSSLKKLSGSQISMEEKLKVITSVCYLRTCGYICV